MRADSERAGIAGRAKTDTKSKRHANIAYKLAAERSGGKLSGKILAALAVELSGGT